jgi:hypothetical protein
MLARHLGAEIFVTCGNEAKVELLNTEFNIPRDHIFSSRTTAFRDKIHAMTNGDGVDVVLNSLGGEMFRESCNTLAAHGRFVEIGRKDLMENALMPMEFLLNNITFAYVDFAHILATKTRLASQLLGDVMKLFASGAVQHVRQIKYPISEMAAAFRLIQAGKHTGKVVLTVEPDVKVQVSEWNEGGGEARSLRDILDRKYITYTDWHFFCNIGCPIKASIRSAQLRGDLHCGRRLRRPGQAARRLDCRERSSPYLHLLQDCSARLGYSELPGQTSIYKSQGPCRKVRREFGGIIEESRGHDSGNHAPDPRIIPSCHGPARCLAGRHDG